MVPYVFEKTLQPQRDAEKRFRGEAEALVDGGPRRLDEQVLEGVGDVAGNGEAQLVRRPQVDLRHAELGPAPLRPEDTCAQH